MDDHPPIRTKQLHDADLGVAAVAIDLDRPWVTGKLALEHAEDFRSVLHLAGRGFAVRPKVAVVAHPRLAVPVIEGGGPEQDFFVAHVQPAVPPYGQRRSRLVANTRPPGRS